MIALYICLALLASIILFFLIGGYVVFFVASVRCKEVEDTFENAFVKIKDNPTLKERLRQDYKWFENIEKEDLTITSHDNLKLFANLIRAKNDKPKGVVICFHGYRSYVRRDLCMQMRILHEENYHVIAVHQRSHRKSEGKYVCYGLKERHDAIRWRKKAGEIFGDDMPVALMGLSMGGATVLMASDLADKNDRALRCIVADCPFISPWTIISEVMRKRYRVPAFPLIYFTNLWFRILARCKLRETTALKSISSSHLPALIFHGDADTFVASEHSKTIAKNSPHNTKLVLIPNADHAAAIFHDEQLYKKELFEFLDKHM